MSIRVMYDGEAFFRHARGGIPRYLSHLISQFAHDPTLGVSPVTPYKWIASKHLHEMDPAFVEVPMPGRVRLPVLRRANARRLRNCAPADIVHHSLYEPEAFARWPGTRHVTTVYDFALSRFPELLPPGHDHPARFAESIHRADAVICISETTTRDLRRFVPDYDKPVFTIPLGVSDTFFDPAPAKLPRLPRRYVLSVSNREKHKNVDVLLRSFARLAERHADLHLVLVGAYLPWETARLKELGIADRTLRLRVSDAALPWLYRRAELMIYPSMWEGFGLPVAEAMASGCPSIVSNVDALTEVGGDSVMAFDAEDDATIVRHAERILSDPGEAERLRRLGLERVRRFTWRRTAELTARAYAEITTN